MLPIFILIFLLLILSGLTTIPLFISLLVVFAVIFRKPWVFFLAFGFGFILDLFFLRFLGQTGLFFIIFALMLFLYEKKFETQTLTFVFFSTFLGSLIYLLIFGYNNVLTQSLVSSLLAILFFKFLSQNSKIKSQKYN